MYNFNFGLAIWALVTFLTVIAIMCIPWFFFLLNLKNLLLRVNPQNRTMSPDHVWLNFIPVFNFYWLIRTVMAVRDSARNEFQSRRWPYGGDFHYTLGLTMAILYIVYAVFNRVHGLSWLGGIAGLASFVLWIIYWVKTHNLMNQLGQPFAQPGYAANPGYPAYGSGYGGYNPPQYGGQPTYQQPQAQQWQPAQAAPQAAAPQWTGPQQSPAPAPAQPATTSTPEAGGQSPSACGACGAALKPDAAFCGACGMPVPKK